MRPGLKMPSGSKACLSLADRAAIGGSSGWNTSMPARVAFSARIRVAWPPNSARVRRISTAPPSVKRRRLDPDQAARPIVGGFDLASCATDCRRASPREDGVVDTRQSGLGLFWNILSVRTSPQNSLLRSCIELERRAVGEQSLASGGSPDSGPMPGNFPRGSQSPRPRPRRSPHPRIARQAPACRCSAPDTS